MIEFLAKGHCRQLTHLDLSGIDALTKRSEQVIEIVNQLSSNEKCPILQALHLNDISINDNQNLLDEIVEAFEVMTEQDYKLEF